MQSEINEDLEEGPATEEEITGEAGSIKQLLAGAILVALVTGALLEAMFAAIVWHLGIGAFLSKEALAVNGPGILVGVLCFVIGILLILKGRSASLGEL